MEIIIFILGRRRLSFFCMEIFLMNHSRSIIVTRAEFGKNILKGLLVHEEGQVCSWYKLVNIFFVTLCNNAPIMQRM
jgi:hypothetical protein